METLSSPGRCGGASACRLIRGSWSCEERNRQRRIARAMQQELWRLLEAAWGVPGQARTAKPVARSDASMDRLANVAGNVCPIPVAS